MITLFEPAYAKVNLTLDVLGKRADGYHDLKSVMQTISLQDDIEIDIGTGKPWSLHCDKEGVPCDERNLAWKAAKAYCDALGKDPDGIEIRMTKRIPSQAGMGGGSSDAAAVLRALNRYYGEPMTITELAELGAQIGSDVPFCVVGGTVMCEGRGERMRRLPDMPECFFVVVKPEFSISTPVLFRKIDEKTIVNRPDHQAMEDALSNGDLSKVARNLCNTFDPVVTEEHPELDDIKSVFRSCGSIGEVMTGSGSALFCLVPDRKSAEKACVVLKSSYSQVFVAKPV